MIARPDTPNYPGRAIVFGGVVDGSSEAIVGGGAAKSGYATRSRSVVWAVVSGKSDAIVGGAGASVESNGEIVLESG